MLLESFYLDPGGHTEDYAGAGAVAPAWTHFGAGMNSTGSIRLPSTVISSSFSISFEGTTYMPVITMHAHAPRGALNHSNNPTYIKSGSSYSYSTSSVRFVENKYVQIKNIVSSSHIGYSASFEKRTYISQVGLYDKDSNLIGIAKMATPVRKREQDQYTFRLKLDI
jgi:hypothetical protein